MCAPQAAPASLVALTAATIPVGARPGLQARFNRHARSFEVNSLSTRSNAPSPTPRSLPAVCAPARPPHGARRPTLMPASWPSMNALVPLPASQQDTLLHHASHGIASTLRATSPPPPAGCPTPYVRGRSPWQAPRPTTARAEPPLLACRPRPSLPHRLHGYWPHQTAER